MYYTRFGHFLKHILFAGDVRYHITFVCQLRCPFFAASSPVSSVMPPVHSWAVVSHFDQYQNGDGQSGFEGTGFDAWQVVLGLPKLFPDELACLLLSSSLPTFSVFCVRPVFGGIAHVCLYRYSRRTRSYRLSVFDETRSGKRALFVFARCKTKHEAPLMTQEDRYAKRNQAQGRSPRWGRTNNWSRRRWRRQQTENKNKCKTQKYYIFFFFFVVFIKKKTSKRTKTTKVNPEILCRCVCRVDTYI